MNILVLGSGGRECAIIAKLKEQRDDLLLFALPGNGGIADMATCLDGSVSDIPRVRNACRENEIDFCVVTPDDPLAIGMVDALEADGIPCFGPSKAAARIEASKAFAKDLMARHHIPTAGYRIFSDYEDARKYISSCPIPIVIKADGLALGKGVIIAQTREEALDALSSLMVSHTFGKSGDTVVIEEFLRGNEVSILAFTDGTTIVPMVSSMDHKKAFDGDTGPNTGGMGTIAPNPFYTKETEEECMKSIFLPTLEAMNEEGCPFKGCLYFGLMVTEEGPKVIEYNSRFGDPETQVVLPLMKSDLLSAMMATRNGTLKECEVEFSTEAACCVVVASKGYPLSAEKGKAITVVPDKDVRLFIAGAQAKDGCLVTSGGRVADVVAVAPTLREAVDKAYRHLSVVSFDGMFHRSDIGKKALEAK